ncbi:type III-A CRISPR-associated protein Csm2 [Oscillatoria sp. HE19RPO]|uniref:type III-A CRISPR-associated protein Csm2 n=1 Tax=Oscillatoria sp. HE19RPO TaxID=2954806 RepID=UPI0020C20FED|nr:type III-A CRISPR-associated protein Csm2 [Oscillatoria sp. HE19RPO]
MTNPVRHPNRQNPPNSPQTPRQSMDITQNIIQTIDGLTGGLQTYDIRALVNHAEKFGPYLKQQRLETNQVRKFLDAINRLKSVLAQENNFSKIDTEVVLLKPKLAYAAARKPAAKPLSEVMSKAIDKVKSKEDFERLVQFIESIIAYHKAAGGN